MKRYSYSPLACKLDPFTATDMQALRALVARLGKWALLLKLANGVLRDRFGHGEALANALAYLNKALDKRGLTAFDAENPQARDAAVSSDPPYQFRTIAWKAICSLPGA